MCCTLTMCLDNQLDARESHQWIHSRRIWRTFESPAAAVRCTAVASAGCPSADTYSLRSYLSDNLLDSTIPSELGSLASLRDLQLGDNRLEGTLPAEVLRLPKLHTLQVNENRLEGTIPADVSAASSLHNMYALVGAPCAC